MTIDEPLDGADHDADRDDTLPATITRGSVTRRRAGRQVAAGATAS
jgi:hypothetical protein